MRRWMFAAFVAFFATAACNSKSQPAPERVAAPEANAANAPGRSGGASGVAAADVQKLLDAWLAAQNGGDFGAYQTLYAKRFTGVRRSGPRTVELDRDGWMKDRKRMFAKRMTVGASETEITTATGSARVLFTQTWSSGTYKDVGPKQIVVVPENGALRIAREEMLASILEDAASGGAAGRDFYPVYEGFVVLASADANDGAGAPRLAGAPSGGIVLTVRDATALPASLPKVGTRLAVYDREGKDACETRIRALRVLGAVIPHFGTQQIWAGNTELNPDAGAPLSDAEIAREAWDMSFHAIAAEVDPACEGGVWARPADLPPAKVGYFPDVRADDEALGKKLLRATPEWAEIQKTWESEYDGKGPWDEASGADGIAVKAMRLGEKRWLIASAAAGIGCGDFSGSLTGIFTSFTSKPALVGLFPVRIGLDAAFDADGDGLPEIFDATDRVVYRVKGTETIDERTFTANNLDCGC